MVRLVEPSSASLVFPRRPISATITPGIENSAISRRAHMRSTISPEFGPGTLNSIRWRSPVKVSDCQSTDRRLVSKILSGDTRARPVRARNRLVAAADIAIRFIAMALQDRRGCARRSLGECRGPCANRKRSADLLMLRVRTGLEVCHFGEEIFQR